MWDDPISGRFKEIIIDDAPYYLNIKKTKEKKKKRMLIGRYESPLGGRRDLVCWPIVLSFIN